MARLVKLQDRLLGTRRPGLGNSDLLDVAQLLLLLHLELALGALLHFLVDAAGCHPKFRWHWRGAVEHHLSPLVAWAWMAAT